MSVQIGTVEAEGIVRIPLEILKKANIRPGERVELRAESRGVWVSKQGSIVDRLAGRLALDPALAAEILESPELDNETC